MASETKNTKAFYNTEIPSDWEVKSIEDVCNIFVGRDLKEDIFSAIETDEFKIPVYSNTVDNEGLYGYYNVEEFSGESLTIVGRGAGLGTAFTRNSKYGAIGRLLVLFPKDQVNAHYVTEFVNGILRIHQESGGIPQLTGEQISKYKISIPSYPEQKTIAQVLSTSDAAIHTTQKLIAQKELRKKWLMQQLLTGKGRLKGFEGEWKEKKLEYFIKDYKQKPTDEDNYEVLTSAKAGLMKQTDYYGDNRITNRDDADYNVIPPNYLTYRSRSDDGLFTFNKNDLGITGLISGYYPVFTIKNGDINFIHMYMNYSRQKLTKYAIGTSQLVLAMNALKEAKFYLPLEEEQTAIAQMLQAADKEISLLKAKAEKLREQKKGMMQVLLTGKVRLKIDN